MKYAIDIDGTITADPERFRMMMADLVNAETSEGNLVICLTGSLSVGADPEELKQKRVLQLRKIGLEGGDDYDDIHVCVGPTPEDVARMKGEYCRDQGVDVFIDDTPMYRKAVKQLSPGTLVLGID